MKHDLALFDFDGTLADSLPWFHQATQRLAARFNFKAVPTEELEAYRYRDASNLMSELNLPLWKVPRVVTAVRRLMAEEIHKISLFAGIKDFCRHAESQGLRLGIVSSNSEDNVQTALGPETCARFACFECGASLLGKASKLRRAARRAGTPIDRTIYIGDELRDLTAATKAGMPFGAVTWGWSPRPAFAPHQPTAIFDTIAEMEDYLLRR